MFSLQPMVTCDPCDSLDTRRCEFSPNVASACDIDTLKPSMAGACNKSNEYLSIFTVYSFHHNTSEVYKMNTFSLNSVLEKKFNRFDPVKCIFLQFQLRIGFAADESTEYRNIAMK